ncbi:hypothetical protein Tco_0950227 [Tanacetum coccineum]
MMTYLKHVGGKKHSDLKTKSFEEIQVLYEKIKRSDDSFICYLVLLEDEKMTYNEQAAGGDHASKERVRKLTVFQGRKMKKKKELEKEPWHKEEDEYDETEELEDVYLNVVIRSNRQRRYFSTLMTVLSILDRDDICAIYQLMMNRYKDETPEGFDKIIWGDLMIMFNQSDNDEFWNAQQNWKIVSWKLHSSSRVHTIMTDEGLVIHMLVENKYPMKKEVLSKLLELKLKTEEDCTMALELIRFVKKQIAELDRTLKDSVWRFGDRILELKSWLVKDQTVSGKDISNLLIANSLLKTIWLSMHHVMAMEHWLVQKQMVFDKDKSSPLIVDSLLKTIWLSIHLVVYNEELTIPEQTSTGKGTSNPLMAGSLPKTTKPTWLDVAVLPRRHVADKEL